MRLRKKLTSVKECLDISVPCWWHGYGLVLPRILYLTLLHICRGWFAIISYSRGVPYFKSEYGCSTEVKKYRWVPLPTSLASPSPIPGSFYSAEFYFSVKSCQIWRALARNNVRTFGRPFRNFIDLQNCWYIAAFFVVVVFLLLLLLLLLLCFLLLLLLFCFLFCLVWFGLVLDTFTLFPFLRINFNVYFSQFPPPVSMLFDVSIHTKRNKIICNIVPGEEGVRRKHETWI